jgi:D-sedoheptulose 7-phosphate isomerase
MLAEQVPEMTLDARTAEFQRVLMSMEVTDGLGEARAAEAGLLSLVEMLEELRSRAGCLYVVGNGGSAAVASHAVTDFLKFGKLRATTLHDASLMTCMANDYGYDVAYARVLRSLACADDTLVAISSSGQSANIRYAAEEMRNLNATVVTLSGFSANNPLRSLGNINVWLDSDDYGIVEIGHQFVLHNLSDRLRLRGDQ